MDSRSSEPDLADGSSTTQRVDTDEASAASTRRQRRVPTSSSSSSTTRRLEGLGKDHRSLPCSMLVMGSHGGEDHDAIDPATGMQDPVRSSRPVLIRASQRVMA